MCKHPPFGDLLVAALVAVVFLSGVGAWAQPPHALLGPGVIGGQAAAAGMVHQAAMMRMFDLNGDGLLEPNEVALARSGLGGVLSNAAGGGSGAGAAGGGAAGGGAAGGWAVGGGPTVGGAAGGGLDGANGGALNGGGFNGGYAGGSNNLLPFLDQNGNGRIDPFEMLAAEMMMGMLAGGMSQQSPAGALPAAMPPQAPVFQPQPVRPAQRPQRGRRPRAQRVAHFAKPKNLAPARKPAARPKKQVQAQGPMVQEAKLRPDRAAPGRKPANAE